MSQFNTTIKKLKKSEETILEERAEIVEKIRVIVSTEQSREENSHTMGGSHPGVDALMKKYREEELSILLRRAFPHFNEEQAKALVADRENLERTIRNVSTAHKFGI